jgi:hypothetical protein
LLKIPELRIARNVFHKKKPGISTTFLKKNTHISIFLSRYYSALKNLVGTFDTAMQQLDEICYQ